MTNFIPIFPLNLVVYPGEKLNLHIFEPRYKQLIAICFADKKPFGIPVVIDGEMKDYGTMVQITDIHKTYEDGRMDIHTQGLSVFRVLESIPVIPDKLYGGAIVSHPANREYQSAAQVKQLLGMVRQLHEVLKVTKEFAKPDDLITSYDLAHHVGLSLNQELELLQILDEAQRCEYLRRHLVEVMPVVKEMEGLRQKIKLNGHFRELKSFGFEEPGGPAE